MSQEDFASKTGVSVNTLRSTENGRLPLSDEMLRRIKAHWYAHWNPHREGWYFAYIGDLPFSKELYEKVVEPISEPNEDELMKNKLRQRFDDVLEATPSEALRGQIMRLSEDLANRAEYSGLDVDLSSTEPLWYLRRAANGKVRLIAKYRSGKTGPIPDRTRNASRKKRPKGH